MSRLGVHSREQTLNSSGTCTRTPETRRRNIFVARVPQSVTVAMTKVQAVDKAVRTATAYRRANFVKPKIHIFGHRLGKQLPNLSEKNVPRPGGEKKIVQISKRHPLERYITVAVRLFAFLFLSLMVVMETASYKKNPTGTTVEDDMYPVQKIDFPGVAVCNINVISRREANVLAEELWRTEGVRGIGNVTLQTIESLIKYMGHLYVFESWEEKQGETRLLHEILTKASTKNYKVLTIMERLVPKCQTLLKRCYWQGERRSCQELFVSRWTQDGYCCTFNYVRWTDGFKREKNENLKIDIEHAEISGIEYGLWVFLESRVDDYYYNILPAKGFKVLIYTASDYPDAPSGGLREILVSPRSEVFLNVIPTSFHSSADVIQYDKKKRQCLFTTELNEFFEGSYSYSQCMMFCRTRDILKICNCIPFFYPSPHGVGKVKTCNLEDLACLKRHRDKWWSVEPTEYGFVSDPYPRHEDEGKDAHLSCDCLPSCENVDYTVSVTGSAIANPVTIGYYGGCQNFNLTSEHTVLSVSFGSSTGTVRLRQDVLYYWYNLMSTYGGLCSLFLGISIVTPIELFYLLCLRLSSWKRRNNLPTAVKSKLEHRKIYWNEIKK